MSFCEVDIPDYQPRNCGIDFAGVVGIGLIDTYETPTLDQLQEPDFWVSKMSENPAKYYVIRNTRGEYTGGEAIEEDDLMGPIVVGANHQAIIESTGMYENCTFWNVVQKHLWKMVLVNSSGLMFYVDKPINPYTKLNNRRSTKSLAFWQTEFKWHDLSNPYILEAPENIFFGTEPLPECVSCFDYTLDFSFVQ
jgi:hypothetical protein